MSAEMHRPLMQYMDKLCADSFKASADRDMGRVNSADGNGVVCCCCQTAIRDGQTSYEVMDQHVCEECINDPDKAWECVDRLWVALKNVYEDVPAAIRRAS